MFRPPPCFSLDRSWAASDGDKRQIQFDTKGVEFGPWIRRFVAQVKRNWFVPYAAMSLKGRVVITFYVHRTGALTDGIVASPSSVDSFNLAARNACLLSTSHSPRHRTQHRMPTSA